MDAANQGFGLIFILALAAANVPFLSERIFLVGPKRAPKIFAWRLVELVVFGLGVIFTGRWLEGRLGQVQAQNWQFYAVVLCVLLTLAFPGFVWRYMRRTQP
ncbi:MAG: DUF2818 family protein [Leptothrix ochracea]|uniref:DUF2818 family protein n=1 Tax=Leptothrix ochracea TaxID=735331 RepID=UPI0034E2AD6E